MNCNKHNQNASAPNNKRHQNPIPLSGASNMTPPPTYVQNQMNDKLNTMPSQHMSETEIKTEFNPEEFKEKENPQLTDFQHAIDIVGRILSKELPCSHCDVLSCVYAHGGCCRDLYLNRTITDVDIILDTQKLQNNAKICSNNHCILRKFYNDNKLEYERISKLMRDDVQLNQWITSDKVINCRYLVNRIISKSTNIVGVRMHCKRLYVVVFNVFCDNNIIIDMIDNTFYCDYGYIERVEQVGQTIDRLYMYLCMENKELRSLNVKYKKEMDVWVQQQGYTQQDFTNDIVHEFKNNSSLVEFVDQQLVKQFDGNGLVKTSSEWLNQFRRSGVGYGYKDFKSMFINKEENKHKEVQLNAIYPISHEQHYECSDTTFNALYFELKDVVGFDANMNYSNDKIKTKWMDVMKDPSGKGIQHVKQGIIAVYTNKAFDICKSQPSMIIFRTLKNCAKLKDKFDQIQVNRELVDAIKRYQQKLFDKQHFVQNQIQGMNALYEYDERKKDAIARHIFCTYSHIDINIRLAVFHLLGIDKSIIELMNHCEQFKARVDSKNNHKNNLYKDQDLIGRMKANLDNPDNVLNKKLKIREDDPKNLNEWNVRMGNLWAENDRNREEMSITLSALLGSNDFAQVINKLTPEKANVVDGNIKRLVYAQIGKEKEKETANNNATTM
eukprot:939350_1